MISTTIARYLFYPSSMISKILEKHVASSLPKFLCNNLLYKLISVFRSGHSTETALIRLTDQILMNMDNDNVTDCTHLYRKDGKRLEQFASITKTK